MFDAQKFYLPFVQRPEVVHLGLSPLELEHWIEADETFPLYYQHKSQLMQHASEKVFAALPDSLPAQEELSEKLLSCLLQAYPYSYSLENDNLCLNAYGVRVPIRSTLPPLQAASLWVQDDICVLEPRDQTYILSAASLCAPSSWHLQEKIGRPIGDIHAPVPELNRKLSAQINHVFTKLSPLRPMQRFNWTVTESNSLAKGVGLESLGENIGNSDSGLYVRVERQTLVRLSRTNAIAFTIRIYLYELEALAPYPGALSALKKAVEAMTPDEVSYKSILPLYPKFRKTCQQLLRT